MKRIICIGNRFVPADSAGPTVFDRLAPRGLPEDLELIDGGLAGLDLLRFVEGAQRIVFVDSIQGFGRPGDVLILEAEEVAATAELTTTHSAGLPYLLRVLPLVCESAMPEIKVVGIKGQPEEATIEKAAGLAMELALGDSGARGGGRTRCVPGNAGAAAALEGWK